MSGDTLLYLSSTDVRRACEEIDPLACVQEALRRYRIDDPTAVAHVKQEGAGA